MSIAIDQKFQWLLYAISIVNGLGGIAGLMTVIFLQCTTVRLKKRRVDERTLWPKISIIVPIHNEQKYLERALTSLCLLDFDNYEIIAIDDRSTDLSNHIVNHLSNKFSQLKIITIATLPPNWLGKTHALHKGLIEATGEYVIFTDADVVFAPSIVKRAVDFMISERLGHLTLAPKIEVSRFSLKLLMPFLLYIMLLGMKPWRFNNNRTNDAVGIGAFNCVHRKEFIGCGGMERLALNPIDDVGLARLIKHHKIKQAIANAEELLTLTWYDTLTECKKGFEKNIFAFFNFSLLKSLFALISYLSFMFFPWLMIFFFPKIGFAVNSLAILSVGFAIMLSCQQLRISKGYALAYPIAALITLFIGIRSINLCIVRKGIYWGGEFFPLQKLILFFKSTD